MGKRMKVFVLLFLANILESLLLLWWWGVVISDKAFISSVILSIALSYSIDRFVIKELK